MGGNVRAGLRLGLARAMCAIVLIGAILSAAPVVAVAAPYAAMVMDARTGEVLHARNADARLHPASLTKMMTLYVVFEAIEAGEVGLDDRIRISRHAASEPPSKLGLQAGSTIELRYLIRAAAVKSANDAATALGEAVSGSEEAFAARMNRTAAALGMTGTTFRNAHGLTEAGHLSTTRDMTVLGRRLFYDHPAYYNLFSRRSTHAGIGEVASTNRRFLAAYRGADGIKTGYTRAAGFNLVASAQRGQARIIATIFGGRSTATRDAHMAELLDMGFARAPAVAALRRPPPPNYDVADGAPLPARGPLAQSPRPPARPDALPSGPDVGPALVAALASEVGAGVLASDVGAEVASRRAGNPSTAALAPPGGGPARDRAAALRLAPARATPSRAGRARGDGSRGGSRGPRRRHRRCGARGRAAPGPRCAARLGDRRGPVRLAPPRRAGAAAHRAHRRRGARRIEARGRAQAHRVRGDLRWAHARGRAARLPPDPRARERLRGDRGLRAQGRPGGRALRAAARRTTRAAPGGFSCKAAPEGFS